MKSANANWSWPSDGKVPNVLDRDPLDSDQQILARVVAGETELFAVIVRRYERALLRVLRGRLGRDDWAEEVVQESFLAAFKSCHSYDRRYSFRTWLWTILLNQCRAHYQRRSRAPNVEPWPDASECEPAVGIESESSSTPLGQLLAKERTAQLESLLARLSPAQADALRLRFFGGLKFQEIAAAMQCSLNTAKNRVRWGLLRLAELLRAGSAAATAQFQRVRYRRTAMIDCDRVFDVLTRGPFPTGAADDAAVEAHLAECHECARLAAALRPAIELFEEAVGPDEGHDLPSYWGEVAVESSELRAAGADTARRVRRSRLRRPLVHYSHAVGELTGSSVWQVAALVALGVFIGSVLRGFAPAESGRTPGGAAPVAQAAVNPPSEAARLPSVAQGSAPEGNATLQLPLVCLDKTPHNRPDELEDNVNWVQRRYVDIEHCCTQCHNAAPDTLIPRSATAAVQKSCRYCHVN